MALRLETEFGGLHRKMYHRDYGLKTATTFWQHLTTEVFKSFSDADLSHAAQPDEDDGIDHRNPSFCRQFVAKNAGILVGFLVFLWVCLCEAKNRESLCLSPSPEFPGERP